MLNVPQIIYHSISYQNIGFVDRGSGTFSTLSDLNFIARLNPFTKSGLFVDQNHIPSWKSSDLGSTNCLEFLPVLIT